MVERRNAPYIRAINKTARRALLSDGEIVPITFLSDLDGEQTDDLDLAVTFVAGSEACGWFVDYLEHFAEPMEVH